MPGAGDHSPDCPIARVLRALLVSAAVALAALVQPSVLPAEELPDPLAGVDIEQNLGGQVPLDLSFRDEMGRKVRLGDFFGEKPVVINLVYYECPMLCTMVLNGLVSSLEVIALEPGADYEIVTVSIDPGESFPLAMAKKKEYVGRLGRPQGAEGWHFLTGQEEEIRRLASAVGFRYSYDPETDLYIHASGIMVATPAGKLSRYLYGVEYPPRDLRLSLVEASEGRIGTVADHVLLFCYQYDPETGRYSAALLNLIRLGGGITVLLIVGYVVRSFRKEAAGRRAHQQAGVRP